MTLHLMVSPCLNCFDSVKKPLRPPSSTIFPYTTLFRSERRNQRTRLAGGLSKPNPQVASRLAAKQRMNSQIWEFIRSEEHTSELQSHHDLVCRLLLEKKNTSSSPLEFLFRVGLFAACIF